MHRKKFFSYKWFIHLFFIIYSLACVLPFLLIISISFTAEDYVVNQGFSLLIHDFSTNAYTHIFQNPKQLLDAYGVTALFAVLGTLISVVVMAMIGYALSRDGFIFKKPINTMLVITMFFNGGLIPTYLVITQVFNLGNTFWVYLTHGVVTAYIVFVFRTFFATIPKSLIESAQLDGANELQILTRITVPLSKPVLATFGFMGLLSRWNDYTVSMYYIQDTELYTLQYMLQQILNEAQFLADLQKNMPHFDGVVNMPEETLKFAMCVVAAGPMMLVFPFFQKYFAKGMVVGAVKG